MRALGCSREGSETGGETISTAQLQGKSFKDWQVLNAASSCQGPEGKM